tara:strand:- start:15806 stop:16993 length:1188 start_codon:yes stop_codon:yes gene_type:complete
MNFDAVAALQLTLVVVSAVFAGANYLAWRLFGRPRHALIWTFAYLLAMGQYLVNLVRDALPSYEFYWLFANLMSTLLVITVVWGHRQRLGRASPWPWAAGLLLAIMLAQLVFTLVLPRADVRVALAPAFACVALLHVAWLLLRHGPEPVLAQRVAAVIHGLFGLAQGLAAGIALQFGAVASPAQGQAYNLVNFALMPTFFVAMGVAVIFLLATDLSNKLRLQAITDQLTGVSNRRGFLQAADLLLARARRHQRPLTMVLADIDLFKRVNDRYGHSIGDRALAHFAQILRDSVRAEDCIGRIGGEEFAIVMGESSVEDAGRMVARVRRTLKQHPLVDNGQEVVLTASFGIAAYDQSDSREILLIRADQALYQAKEAGRDSVIVAADVHPVGMVSHG